MQFPDPSHVEAAVNVAEEHDAAPQLVSVPTKAAHVVPSLPSHVLAAHVVVPASHLVRVP